MKIAVCTKVNHIEIQQQPIPSIDDTKVLVRVSVCGICGSDLAAWRGSGHKKYPYTPGHEFCGTIEDMGAKVTGLTPGQQIVVDPNLGCGECRFCKIGKPNICDQLKTRPIKSNGGFAEYVALDFRMAHLLPDGISHELATFIEPLSCAVHAANRARAASGDRVAIFGAGLMGFLTAIALKKSGADLIVIEPAPKRRELPGSLLNVATYSPSDLTESALADEIDIAIDCSGNARAVAQAVKLVRKAGRIILAGLVLDPRAADISLIDITTKELELAGVWLNPDTFDQALNLVLEYQDILSQLNTAAFTLDDIAAAFKKAADPDTVKVFVKP